MPPTEPTIAPTAETPAPPAPVEQAPAPVVTSAPAAPVAAPAPVTKPDFSKLSREDRLAIALGKTPAVTPTAPAAPSPAAATPPADPAAGDEAHKLPDRFRFTSEDDQMVALLSKREGISLVEAARRYDTLRNPGTSQAAAPTAPAAAKAENPPPAPVVAPEVARLAEIDTAITAKRAEIKKLRDEMEHDKADELMIEVATLTGEKMLLAREAKQSEQQAAQSYESAVMASRERAFTQFPVFGDPTSMEHDGLIGYVTREQNKPERQAFFQRPDFPELIAKEYAQLKGIQAGAAKPAGSPPATPPAAATTAASTAPAVTRPQAKQVPAYSADGRLLTTAAGIAPAQRELTAQDAIKAARTDPKLRAQLRQAVMGAPKPAR